VGVELFEFGRVGHGGCGVGSRFRSWRAVRPRSATVSGYSCEAFRMPATPPWYVISLRPRGDHAALRRAATRHGGGVIALSPWRLQRCDDAATRGALRLALAAPRVVFTSPAAVRAARALQAFAPRREQAWCAVGAGTAAALRRAGVHDVHAPTRMDSEGL
jgi:uroporphyrinogen-III synthase